MTEASHFATAPNQVSSAKTWLRALELTQPIANQPRRILSSVIHEAATTIGDRFALLSEGECFTYRQLSGRANRYARWALAQGFQKGDVVSLLMGNRPEYMAIWLGITSIGAVVSLLNINLVGASLKHCIDAVAPKAIIASSEFDEILIRTLSDSNPSFRVWTHGQGKEQLPRIDVEVEAYSEQVLSDDECCSPSIHDLALYIYTSGTTGFPKAANISHGRVMQWTHWFSGMMDVSTSDRLYNCLPMYHSIGGVQAPGAMLAAGGTVVLRAKFSASQFWNDIYRWDCTIFQYIGELCRYLLHAPISPYEREHRLRLACGNGLASELWGAFKQRFAVPRILEFYAATEGGVSLFNIQGEPGAIGHIPQYLAHRFSPAIVRFDYESGNPVRNHDGFCIRCGANEPGEALMEETGDPPGVGNRFEGYKDEGASERRRLRNVFSQGDSWVRTGDILRKDGRGYFYFVDRIGDTFRWKGENVSTSEVAEAICAYPDIEHASVYGVAVRGSDGRAGMATLVTGKPLDLEEFHAHVARRLPSFARPLFLRIRSEVDLTGTFKYSKTELIKLGFDPLSSSDAIFFDHPDLVTYIPLDAEMHRRIIAGEIRL